MRLSGMFLSVPQSVLTIAIAQTLGPSLQSGILALSAPYRSFWARLLYAETRSALNETYVEASVALGARPWWVMCLGKVVELGATESVFSSPRHP